MYERIVGTHPSSLTSAVHGDDFAMVAAVKDEKHIILAAFEPTVEAREALDGATRLLQRLHRNRKNIFCMLPGHW